MEITNISLVDQNRIIDSFLKTVKLLGNVIVSKKVSRYKSDYKALQISSSLPVETFFEKLNFNVSVNEASSEISRIISGKYKVIIITFKSGKDNIKTGDQFYCVNTFTERGSVKSKELSPDKLKIAGIQYKNKNIIDNNIQSSIESLKIEPAISEFLNKIYKLTKESSANDIKFLEENKKLISLIKPQDIQAIGKDFGEVLSARWLLNQKEYDQIEWLQFPLASNEKLIDFSIKTKNRLIRFSAKFERGAAPSIESIVSEIDSIYKTPDQDEKKYINVLKSLTNPGVSNNILKAIKHLKMPVYSKLEKILKVQNFELKDLSNFIRDNISKKFKTPSARIEEFHKLFDETLKMMNKDVKNDSLLVVFAAERYTKEIASPIISPMGYYLVEILNSDPKFKQMLNNIANSIDVHQIYLDLNSQGFSFEIKKFSDAKFSFAYGANAKDSNNTGIKFKMTR